MGNSLFGGKMNLKIYHVVIVFVLIMLIMTGFSCSNNGMYGMYENFTGANINDGQSSPYKLNNYSKVNTSSWYASDLTDSSSKGAQSILNRPKQQVPLPNGELLLFKNTKFKPECCQNTYSTSTGCACMSMNQYNYLKLRGGNNVPYSQY